MGWGSVLALGGYTLTLSGPVVFYIDSQTPLISGPGTLITQGTTTVGGGGNPALTIGSTVTWQNTGLVTQTQSLTVGNSSSQSASLVNNSGGVFDLSGYVAINNGSTPTSAFSNAGTLEMTGSNTTGYVRLNLSSTGLLSAVSGSNLELDGPTNTISGTISGAGQVSFGAGTTTLAGGVAVTAGTLAIYNNGTDLLLGGNESISSSVSIGWGSVLSLGGNTLTLTGPVVFYIDSQTPLISGPGTVITQGTTTIGGGGNPALTIGSGVTWQNAGLVTETQSFTVGNSASQSASLVNNAGGVFDLAGYVAINNGGTPTSTLTNAGTLEMTGGNTTGYVRVDLLSTGVVSTVVGSNLELDGPANTISGAITGTGQVSFGAGTTTVAGGTSISAATLALYNAGTDLTLGGNVTVSGTSNDNNATTISLAGHTLTLAAAAVFNQNYGTPLIAGKGTLVTKGATSVGGSSTGLVLGGTATWNNFGMVTDSQSVQFGDSTNGAAIVNNEKGGVFDIVVNGVTLSNGSTLASTFTNAGLLEMTTGGSASLAANVTNTGTILAQTGGLALSGAITGTGVLDIQSNGALGFSSTVQSTEAAKFLDTTGRLNVTLPSASAFGAEIIGFVAGDTIDLTNISNATGAFSAGVLTFTDNKSHAVVATLNFSNSPSFAFANDGRGGTLISATSTKARGPGPVPQAMQFISPQATAEKFSLLAFPNLADETTVSTIFSGVPEAAQAEDGASDFPEIGSANPTWARMPWGCTLGVRKTPGSPCLGALWRDTTFRA